MHDGLRAVKGRHGILDRWIEGQRMDHGRLALGDVDKSKCSTCEEGGEDVVD